MHAVILMASLLIGGTWLVPTITYAEKPVIGAVEEVLLLPWGITMRARVDTGAATSSLDARGIRIRGRGGSRIVHFTLIGRSDQPIGVDLPLIGNRRVRNSDGLSERRPVVRIEVCLGKLRMPMEVTLNDRSGLEHPMLLGRNVLEGRFLVDVERVLTTPPACPSGS